jgi:hypothetical protein
MSGVGTVQAGFGPCGLGTPISGDPPPLPGAGSRYINPASGDYEQDPTTKQLAQMPAVRQRVLLALITVIESSNAAPGLGIRLPRKMGTTYEAEVRAEVMLALNQLVEVEKVIRVDSIEVLRGAGGRSQITVSFTDTTTGLRDRVAS